MTMQTTEELIRAAQLAQNRPLPKWAHQLIADLTYRLDLEHRSAQGARARAEKEVEEARALLQEGPADSDTFLDLPRAMSTYPDEVEQRPLGRGASVEFRAPADEPGEGYTVRRVDGGLKVTSISRLAIRPVDIHTIEITEF